VLFFDLETYKIGRRLAPRVVSVCYAVDDTRPILLGRRGLPAFVELFRSQDLIIGHNPAYDFGCLAAEFPELIPEIFQAYADGRIADTMTTEKLIAIEAGDLDRRRFSLAALVKKYLKTDISGKQGEDIWRLRYAELDGIDPGDWPTDAREYALNDVVYTRAVFKKQNYPIKRTAAQNCAAWALHLISIYGMRINPQRAADWLEAVAVDVEKGRELARGLGILRDNGTRNVKKLREIVLDAYDGNPPRTDKGATKTDGETLKNSGNPALVAYADSRFADKLATTYAPILQGGATVHPQYNVLVKTGRTSCRKPNMQNPPRGGGFREVFEPRPGFVYALCDYDQIELVALGQIHLWMFKTSAIADAVNEGRDLHLEVAARLNPEDPPAYRQASKAANYGFAGGLGSEAFRDYARGSGVDISEDDAKEIRAAWLKTWPEMKKYFTHISNKTTWGPCEITQFKSGRVRGGCTYTQGANTYFQGLVADGCKSALFNVSRACYTDKKSPLYGSRPVAFLHDEIIIEAPEEKAAGAAQELSRVMIEIMTEWIPDVKIGASAYLSRVWSKKAGPVYDAGGGLLPWEP
jgi:DNA polymerase-1